MASPGKWYAEKRPPTSRGRWVAVALVLALVALLVGTARVLADANTAAGGPTSTVLRYCHALEAHDYVRAYSYIALAARGGLTASQYADEAHLRDLVDGIVLHCDPTDPVGAGGLGRGLGIVFGATTETVDLTIVRATLGTLTGTLTMTRGGRSPAASARVVWLIHAADPALAGTPIAPIEAAASFCGDILAGNYNAAYTALSTAQQKLAHGDTTFTDVAKPPQGIRYTSCAPVYSTYRVDGATASVSINLGTSISLPTWSANETDPFTLVLVRQAGSWKINGIIPPRTGP